MLEGLVLKNDAECISQRLKRTSGPRVMIISSFQETLNSLVQDFCMGVRFM